MLILRDYQQELKQSIYGAWGAGHKNVLAVMPTGMGKTKTFCSVAIDMAITAQEKLPTAILVHRKELVQQISLTLAEEEIVHNIVAPRPVISGIVAAHRRVLGKQFYNHQAIVNVLSVDTAIARAHKHKALYDRIRLWITDEATHLLAANKWGKSVAFFPNAIGLGVTATPQRLDKRGLGRHADGVFDTMIEGPTTRWGIDNGHLCKYKIAIPASDYRSFLGKASDGSDFSKEAMLQASTKSHIIGDVVTNYRKFADDKQAILFATDVVTGHKMEERFRSAGITAKLLTAETPDKERLDALIDYRNKKIKVLLNVDLFDEGLDVPGIEAVIMARPTESLTKYLQMIGRGLRPAPGKPFLMIIDHVGNVATHGLPDRKREWTLDRIVKRQHKTNFMRVCQSVTCNAPYDRHLTECPYCGTEAISMRSGGGGGKVLPQEVDGDLFLIDSETLRELEKQAVLENPVNTQRRVAAAAGPEAGKKALKKQAERIKTQQELVHLVAKWAGWQKHCGLTDRGIHKQFYLEFDQTITEALSEPTADMLNTMDRIDVSMPPLLRAQGEIGDVRRKAKAKS